MKKSEICMYDVTVTYVYLYIYSTPDVPKSPVSKSGVPIPIPVPVPIPVPKFPGNLANNFSFLFSPAAIVKCVIQSLLGNKMLSILSL